MIVNTEGLENVANVLLQLSRQMGDIQSSVHQATKKLIRESVGERFQPALQQSMRNIAQCSRDLQVLRTALQQITQCYERTELRLLEETDNVPTYNEAVFWRMQPVPGIDHLLMQEDAIPPAVEPFLESMFPARDAHTDDVIQQIPSFSGGLDIHTVPPDMQSIIDSVAQAVAEAFVEDNMGNGGNDDIFQRVSEATGNFEIDWTPWEP